MTEPILTDYVANNCLSIVSVQNGGYVIQVSGQINKTLTEVKHCLGEVINDFCYLMNRLTTYEYGNSHYGAEDDE